MGPCGSRCGYAAGFTPNVHVTPVLKKDKVNKPFEGYPFMFLSFGAIFSVKVARFRQGTLMFL